MMWYITDDHGRRYEVDVTTEVEKVQTGTFADPYVETTAVLYTVKVQADVGEGLLSASPESDPTDVLYAIFDKARELVRVWNEQ